MCFEEGMGGLQIFVLLRSPSKVLEPYDNPFCGFRYGMRKEEERKKEK
jgi:hypothetical protein